jgi:hypothetical protein
LDTYTEPPPTEYRYRNAPRRTALLRWLLRLDIAVSVIFLMVSAAAPLVAPPAKLAGMVSAAWALVALLSLVSLLIWIFRAAANVRGLGADISFDPPWAVGWLIVPVVNVWMAFVVIEEIWRASLDAHDWHTHNAPWLVIYWWLAWVAACLLGVLAYFTGVLPVMLAWLAAHIAYAWLLIPVVDRICDLQNAQASRLGLA